MTNEQIIGRGDAAMSVMTNDMFNVVIKELHQSNVDTFMNSTPEDSKEREVAYYRNIALQDILGLLTSWVTMRDQILTELENTQHDD